MTRPRLLIEEWLPIADIGEESVRERRSDDALPPTISPPRLVGETAPGGQPGGDPGQPAAGRRRPGKFLHMLGIHGDPWRAKIDDCRRRVVPGRGSRTRTVQSSIFSYTPKRVMSDWLIEESEKAGLETATVLDPTAGGGSIPFEASPARMLTIANDLNPVAWLILKATVEFPLKYGLPLLKRYQELAAELATSG